MLTGTKDERLFPYEIMKLLKYIIFSILLLSISNADGQEINKENSTYFRVDYDYTPDFIEWKGEEYRNIYFEGRTVSQAQGLMLKIKRTYFNKLARNNFSPFVLDTGSWNGSSYHFYANEAYFTSLKQIDATSLQDRTTVGQLKNPIKANKKTIQQLFRLLITFGVIDTYFHLYSELIITDIVESESSIEISYSCIYHFCTSECFHPKYTFKLQFNKESREIVFLR